MIGFLLENNYFYCQSRKSSKIMKHQEIGHLVLIKHTTQVMIIKMRFEKQQNPCVSILDAMTFVTVSQVRKLLISCH